MEKKIRDHITARSGGECLTFVERDKGGAVIRIWKPVASMDYIKCLSNFCTGSRLNGHDLDSYLTDDVVKIVTKEFEVFYDTNSDEIAPILTKIIIQDAVF